MEKAAMAAYLKDVKNNTMDMTAEKIIRDNEIKTEKTSFSPEIDPCDPISQTNAPAQLRVQGTHASSGENKAQGKSKAGKGTGKGKKVPGDDYTVKQNMKKWYEARTPEGYTYYWHIETNVSVWEPPNEGFMTLEEQENEAKEQAIQEEFLQQIKKEEEEKNTELLEEQRAAIEREKLKESRLKEMKIKNEDEEEKIPYRRDYSVPEKPQPYGAWQPVQKIEQKPVDLQLPEKKQMAYVPSLQNTDPIPPQKIFKEKTITTISTGDSDDEGSHLTFKKRKVGNKNVRKRLMND